MSMLLKKKSDGNGGGVNLREDCRSISSRLRSSGGVHGFIGLSGRSNQELAGLVNDPGLVELLEYRLEFTVVLGLHQGSLMFKFELAFGKFHCSKFLVNKFFGGLSFLEFLLRGSIWPFLQEVSSSTFLSYGIEKKFKSNGKEKAYGEHPLHC